MDGIYSSYYEVFRYGKLEINGIKLGLIKKICTGLLIWIY